MNYYFVFIDTSKDRTMADDAIISSYFSILSIQDEKFKNTD
jgi:hypothetical protein